MPACKNCFYAHDTTAHNVIGASSEAFECRYDPPAVLPMQRVNEVTGKMEVGTMAAFPTVSGDLFCGKFKNRN